MFFDAALLAKDILAKREKENLSFRSIPVPVHVLHSMEAMRGRPFCDSLATVLDWLDKPAERYFYKK